MSKRAIARYVMMLIIALPAIAQLYGQLVGFPKVSSDSPPTPAFVVTKHAACRMECRHISRADIDMVLERGVLNERKSDLEGRPCPTFAYEGPNQSGEQLRVVLAECPQEERVVTVINLEKKFNCNC